jgi:hypothetical protein
MDYNLELFRFVITLDSIHYIIMYINTKLTVKVDNKVKKV